MSHGTNQRNNFPNLLRGTSAADIIKGYGGVDALYGLGGNDNVYDGPGNDYLNGGKGNDHLWGGGGHDFFEFKKGDGHFDPGTGKGDIVMDAKTVSTGSTFQGRACPPSVLPPSIRWPATGTFVTYNGGSFFILGFDGSFAPDDFK